MKAGKTESASKAELARIRRLTHHDIDEMRQLLNLFGDVFGEANIYKANQPSDTYLSNLLGRESFVAISATMDRAIVGGLAAYELEKFEQERSEYYIYDLAVSLSHRRCGIATAMIDELIRIAAKNRGYVVFVQADQGDDPAILLYEKLGKREEVLHFDIQIPKQSPAI